MSFKPDEFTASLNKRGFAKTSHFEIRISGRVGASGTERDMVMRADTAEIPGRTMSTAEYRTYGPIRKIPYGSTYTDTTIGIICSSDLAEKVYFEQWQNVIHNNLPMAQSGSVSSQLGHYNLGYYDDYKGRVELVTFDEVGNTTSKHTFQEAYPIGIAPIGLSWGADEIMKLNITFAYRDYLFDNNFEPKPAPKPNVGISGSVNIGGVNIGGNFNLNGSSNLSVGGFKVPIPKIPQVGKLGKLVGGGFSSPRF